MDQFSKIKSHQKPGSSGKILMIESFKSVGQSRLCGAENANITVFTVSIGAI